MCGGVSKYLKDLKVKSGCHNILLRCVFVKIVPVQFACTRLLKEFCLSFGNAEWFRKHMWIGESELFNDCVTICVEQLCSSSIKKEYLYLSSII